MLNQKFHSLSENICSGPLLGERPYSYSRLYWRQLQRFSLARSSAIGLRFRAKLESRPLYSGGEVVLMEHGLRCSK